MEKRAPHCGLTVVKALVQAGQVRATHSARLGATGLRFDFSDMLAVVLALTTSDFYKSMTTHADHTVWQDVYRPRIKCSVRRCAALKNRVFVALASLQILAMPLGIAVVCA